jgi:hypothetical protein
VRLDGRLRVLVLGYIVRGPLGGMAWHHLQYVAGLDRIGHDVWFIEDSEDYPSCYDPRSDELGTDPSFGLGFAARAFDRLGLGSRWAYHDAHTGRWAGPAADKFPALCATADLVLNISGVNPLRPWLSSVPARALIDTDPAFTQIRHLQDSTAAREATDHTAFFTYAENIGRPGCAVPDDGLPWLGTRQPIALDLWPMTPPREDGAFTTVMQWDAYRAREHERIRYGMKSASFLPYLLLPSRTHARLEIALGSAPKDVHERLRAAGWGLRSSLAVTRDPWSYQRYVQRSLAELSVAKHGYVVSRSGWFSERTAGYLASARPAVVQDTGFSDWLPTGDGLLAFESPEQALDGIEQIRRAPAHHARAARELVAEHFDAHKVLGQLIEQALGTT